MIWLTRSTRDRVTPAEMSSSDVPRRHQRLVRSSPRQQRGSDLIPASSIQPQSISVGIHHILLRPLISDELKSVLKLTLTRCEKRPVVSRSPNRDDCQLYRQLRRGWRDQPGRAGRVRPLPTQCRGASGSDQPQLYHQRSCPTGSDAMRGRFGRSKNPFPMDLGSGAIESRRYRPAPAARTPLAAAAGRPCRLWRYLFDDAVGQLQQ